MALYDVEFISHIYVTVPVEAKSLEEAEKLADATLPRYPVVAAMSDSAPTGATVSVSKEWTLNYDAMDDEDEDADDV
jgi:hypothetical protein